MNASEANPHLRLAGLPLLTSTADNDEIAEALANAAQILDTNNQRKTT
jgi:hypothetical protein